MRKDVKTKKSNYFQNLFLNLNVNITIYMHMYTVRSIYLSTWWSVSPRLTVGYHTALFLYDHLFNPLLEPLTDMRGCI